RRALDTALQILPIKLTKIGRTAIYGSFFNFYLCQFQGKVILPKSVVMTGVPGTTQITYPLAGGPSNPRCHLG
ncbi:MAG: hypothetical protein M3Z50_12020, partial [Actinomycetota bacterium]|nr:hypothetical protein [Actinomycetota bacterium]